MAIYRTAIRQSQSPGAVVGEPGVRLNLADAIDLEYRRGGYAIPRKALEALEHVGRDGCAVAIDVHGAPEHKLLLLREALVRRGGLVSSCICSMFAPLLSTDGLVGGYLAVNAASTLPDPTADESPDTSAIFPMRV